MKILTAEKWINELNTTYCYELTWSYTVEEDIGVVVHYGISIYDTTSQLKRGKHISDITTDFSFAKSLFKTIAENSVLPEHRVRHRRCKNRIKITLSKLLRHAPKMYSLQLDLIIERKNTK